MTEAHQDLRRKAETCRRLAASIGDGSTIDTLLALARQYEAEAEALETLAPEPRIPIR